MEATSSTAQTTTYGDAAPNNLQVHVFLFASCLRSQIIMPANAAGKVWSWFVRGGTQIWNIQLAFKLYMVCKGIGRHCWRLRWLWSSWFDLLHVLGFSRVSISKLFWAKWFGQTYAPWSIGETEESHTEVDREQDSPVLQEALVCLLVMMQCHLLVLVVHVEGYVVES